MADVVTTTQTGGLTLVQNAYEMMVRWPLRAQLFFDRVASVKPTRQDRPGMTVTFTIMNDLAAAVTPLSETVDVDAVSFINATASITLNEYGNAVMTTHRLRVMSFAEIDPIVANLIGYNMGISQDTLASVPVYSGTTVTYIGQANRASLTAANKLTTAQIRKEVAKLREANVPDWGGYYTGFVHPDVSVDLRNETGAAGWSDVHNYSSPEERWRGEIGQRYEGVRWIESPRAPKLAGAGASGADVYQTVILGQDAVAKAWSTKEGNGPGPRVVVGPVTDKLRRLHPVGWYWLGGYGVFRQAALRRIEHGSGIAA